MKENITRLTPDNVIELIEYKNKIKNQLITEIGDEHRVIKALENPHAKRKPIACGLTIHPAYGCSYACTYCYIYSMGFKHQPQENPLTSNELALSLAANPYFVPGIQGTLLAFGSITEPFMNKKITMKTLDYMTRLKKVYRNPIQVSTKAVLDEDTITHLIDNLNKEISFLITITTIREHRKLEPNAPPPEERFRLMKTLSDNGVPVYLFLRPLIPGLIEKELPDIMRMARENGARGVIPGSLRITRSILVKLGALGINTREILIRTPVKHIDDTRQVSIDTSDIKKKIWKHARAIGLRLFPSSCSVNIDAHGLGCWACKYGPCGDPGKIPRLSAYDAQEILNYFGLKPSNLEVGEDQIILETKKRKVEVKEKIGIEWLRALSKRRIVLKKE